MEATREAAEKLGLRKLGLLGTRFTMQGRFYPEVFSKAGIALVVPEEKAQAYILRDVSWVRSRVTRSAFNALYPHAE